MRLLLCIFAGQLLLAACAEDPAAPTRSLAPSLAKSSYDLDGDGFESPDDCQDQGIRWATLGAPCDGASQPLFVPGDGKKAKDFALIDDAGEYHIFHIRGDGVWGIGDNETTFGHESSFDLLNWSAHPPLDLRGGSGDWNDRNIWAPHVLRQGSQWWMYYAGVSYTEDRAFNLQRIGLAISDDLFTWTPAATECDGVPGAGCLLDCEALWSLWGSGGEYTGDCRDPFVLPFAGGYVMFLSARRSDYKEVIARATSPDGLSWSLLDYIPGSEGTKAESPAALLRNGRVELYWTASSGIVMSSATDPLGSFSSRAYVSIGYAAELMPYPDASYAMPYVDGGRIAFQRLSWNASEQRLLDWNVSPLCWVHASEIHPSSSDPANGVDDNCDGYPDLVVPWVPPGDPQDPPKSELRFGEAVRGSF